MPTEKEWDERVKKMVKRNKKLLKQKNK